MLHVDPHSTRLDFSTDTGTDSTVDLLSPSLFDLLCALSLAASARHHSESVHQPSSSARDALPCHPPSSSNFGEMSAASFHSQ